MVGVCQGSLSLSSPVYIVVHKIRRRLHRNAVQGVDNAMPFHRTGYDRRNIRTPATQILERDKTKH